MLTFNHLKHLTQLKELYLHLSMLSKLQKAVDKWHSADHSVQEKGQPAVEEKRHHIGARSSAGEVTGAMAIYSY